MNVGELKALLAQYPDTLPIKLQDWSENYRSATPLEKAVVVFVTDKAASESYLELGVRAWTT